MKICLINNLYEPYARGGAEQVVRTIAHGLKTAQGEVFVITTNKRPRQAEVGGIKVFYIKPANLFWFGDINQKSAWLRLFWHGLDMFNFSGRNQIKKILEKERPDIVNTHNLKGVSFLIPRLIKKLRIKHLHTVHDTQLANPMGLIIAGEENNWRQTFFLTRLYTKINRWLFGSPNAVISPSQWLLNFYEERGFFKNSKLVHLPNPVSSGGRGQLPTPNPEGDIPECRLPGDDNRNLLFLGQLEKHKGILFLIEALLGCHSGGSHDEVVATDRISSLNGLDFRLTIAGDGSQKEKIKELIKSDNRFELLGKVEHEKINQLFQKTRYLIVPSLCYENSPTVIYEALASGTPVIAADIGGCAELIKEGENGFVFRAGDSSDLINKIKKALVTKLGGNLAGDYGVEKYLDIFKK